MFSDIFETVKDQAVEHMPELMIGFGLSAILAGTVGACKATLGLHEDLEEHREEMEAIDEEAEKAEEEGKEYNKGQKKMKIFGKTFAKICRRYAVPVIAIIAGIALIVGGDLELNARNFAAVSLANNWKEAFDEYRKRNIELNGEEADEKIRTGAHEIEVEETGKNGKTKKVKKTVGDENAKGRGYLFWITPSNPYWVDDEEQMMYFFNSEERTSNVRLALEGRYTLDLLCNQLGVKMDNLPAEYMQVGWLKNSGLGNPNDKLHIRYNVVAKDMPDGNGELVRCYAIDPNVECNVYKMKRRQERLARKEAA